MDDTDASLAERLRAICLALPEVTERPQPSDQDGAAGAAGSGEITGRARGRLPGRG